MVRPSGSVLAYLPEPPGWRAHPPGRLPVDAADPCWSLDPAPAVVGSRPLAIVEVVDYDLFVLGTSRVITLDPLGVLEERLGDEAVRRVQRALRESRTYPSLSSAGDALHIAIFGEPGPTQWLFEAIVTPHVYASPALWDTRLLGRRKMLGTYRDREFELDTSPDLACCNMDVLHPVSRPPSDARRHWTVRICQITPLVRRGLTDREAKAMLQQVLDLEARDPSRLVLGAKRRGRGGAKVSQLGGDARPERDHGCVAPPPSRERAVGGGRGGAQGGRDDPNLLRVLELLERRDALRSRREWAEADRVKEELVALLVRLDDGNKRWSIRGGASGRPAEAAEAVAAARHPPEQPRASAATHGPSAPSGASTRCASPRCGRATWCFCTPSGCPRGRARTSRTSSSGRGGPSGGSAAATRPATSASSPKPPPPNRRASPSSSRRGR